MLIGRSVVSIIKTDVIMLYAYPSSVLIEIIVVTFQGLVPTAPFYLRLLYTFNIVKYFVGKPV